MLQSHSSQDLIMLNELTSFDTTFKHHTVKVNNIRLHYVIGGKGKPIVLLHGWLQTWYAWRHIMPLLAQYYTVVAPDLRGFGDSSKPVIGYDSQTVATDIKGLVDYLGFKDIFLVAHDMGVPPAYAYASEYPKYVRRLAILEEIIPGFGWKELAKYSAETSRQGGTWHFAFNLIPDLPETLVTGKERAFLSYFYRKYSYNPTAITEIDIDEFVRCYSAPGGLRGSFGCYRAVFESEEQHKKYAKQKLKMPVLAFGGDHSFGNKVQETMEKLAENSSGVVVERCGHFIANERPNFLAQTLLSFFDE